MPRTRPLRRPFRLAKLAAAARAKADVFEAAAAAAPHQGPLGMLQTARGGDVRVVTRHARGVRGIARGGRPVALFSVRVWQQQKVHQPQSPNMVCQACSMQPETESGTVTRKRVACKTRHKVPLPPGRPVVHAPEVCC